MKLRNCLILLMRMPAKLKGMRAQTTNIDHVGWKLCVKKCDTVISTANARIATLKNMIAKKLVTSKIKALIMKNDNMVKTKTDT